MTELEGRRQRPRNNRKKVLEQRGIRLQVRWQLKKHGAKFSRTRQGRDRRQKTRQKFFSSLQSLNVGNYLMRLHAETKLRRRLLHPVLDCGFFHQLPEREIHFYRIELRRVMLEKLLLRQLGGIEVGLPCRISPSGCPDK